MEKQVETAMKAHTSEQVLCVVWLLTYVIHDDYFPA